MRWVLTIAALSVAAPAAAQPPATEGGQGRANEQREAEMQLLTPDQKQMVKGILARYSEAALTPEAAKAINEAFRTAGLRRGPGLEQAIADAGFDPRKLSSLAPSPNQGGPGGPGRGEPRNSGGSRGRGQYSIEQATSDRAQLNTIAFDALAFLTGNLGSYTFLPPGKVSDFFGFQYMRDIDSGQLGHNTSFVPRVANNVLFVLTEKQRTQLVALAAEQESLMRAFAYKRFPLVKAFRRLLEGDIPAGKAGLDRDAVAKYVADLYEVDGELSYRRAAVVGDIIAHLDAQQKAYLGKMAFCDSSTWPDLGDQIDKRTLPPGRHVAVMTYASELFSWYAGSIEADTYFCPERHATYFGSFYMKDIPAMGNPGYSISTQLTGDSGEAFLAMLSDSQRRLITGLVDLQREPLKNIVDLRRAISTELRRFLIGQTADKQAVLSLARKYGELDGAISYHSATRFAEANRTLSAAQREKLLRLRNLENYPCTGAYVYSDPIAMPQIENTDFLFGVAK